MLRLSGQDASFPYMETPSAHMHVAGLSLGPLVDGMRLNITLTSYAGTMFFGFMGCRETLGDVWSLTRGVSESLEELGKAAKARRA